MVHSVHFGGEIDPTPTMRAPIEPPTDPRRADALRRLATCNAARAEVKEHYAMLRDLLDALDAEAHAARAGGKRQQFLELSREVVRTQAAALRCLKALVSVTNEAGLIEAELDMLGRTVGDGPALARLRPLVSESEGLRPLVGVV